MSHKRWYSAFNPETNKWGTLGVPYDNGEFQSEELFIGAFKTKRAADYATFIGWSILNVSPKVIEKMAKEAEKTNAIAVEKVLQALPTIEKPIPSNPSSYSQLIRTMMD